MNLDKGDTRLIIEECKKRSLTRSQAAYVLATAFHETSHTMKPVRETLAKTDAEAKRRLTKAWKAGKMPGVKSDYWSGGYYGRGYPQTTHLANYRWASEVTGVDLVKYPDRMMEPQVAVTVMLVGMIEGRFRKGHKLSRYITREKSDFYGAREIINGDKGRNGKAIADLAYDYDRALKADGYGVDLPISAPKPAQKPEAAPAPAADPVYDPLPPDRIVDRTTIAQIQADLWAMGFTEVGSRKSDGTFDGVPGKYTEGAAMAFRKEYGLPISANLDLLLIEQMAAAKIEEWKRVMPKREAAPIEEVVDKVPEAAANKATRDTAAGGIVLGVLYAIMDAVVANFNEAKNLVAPLGDYVSTKWVTVLLIILVCIYLYVKAQGGLQSAVARWREGASR